MKIKQFNFHDYIYIQIYILRNPSIDFSVDNLELLQEKILFITS